MAVMARPVRAPEREAMRVGTRRWRPEVVAVVRRTPWKKRGLGWRWVSCGSVGWDGGGRWCGGLTC